MKMAEEQQDRIKDGEQDLNRISEWKELTGQEQNNLLADLETLVSEVAEDLSGLRILVNQEYTIQSSLQDLKTAQKIGQQRLQEKLKEEQEEAKKAGQKKSHGS